MSRKPDPYGRDARRPYHIPLRGWWQVIHRVWTESGRDNLSVVAAGCAFFALFAIFPALTALTVGSMFATTVWLLASAAFSYYVANFAHYDRFYGSLGAVIILLFWLYISFYIVLLGAEINAELELQTAMDTTSGPPRPIGERGAFVADHVAGGPGGDKRPSRPVLESEEAKPGAS